MEETVPSWEEFVERHLLRAGKLSGVLMMSPKGTVSYRYGNLSTLQQENLQQIVDLFSTEISKDKTAVIGGLTLNLSSQLIDFKIYKKTFCSVYCVSPGDSSGIVVSKLPYGILVCSYQHPTTSSQATTLIENFCDMLRS